MEVLITVIAVAGITILAVAVGYRMGRGGRIVAPIKKKEREADRQAAIVATNIDRYDGTANGQREVK